MTSPLGTLLSKSDYEKLEAKSWINRELADAAGIFRVSSQQGADIVGRGNTRDYAGIVFPYTDPLTNRVRGYRLRRDNPEYEYDADGSLKEVNKYLCAPGDRNKLYFPPGINPEMLNHTSFMVVLTEGEKKTLALWRLARDGRNSPLFIPIGVSGVSN